MSSSAAPGPAAGKKIPWGKLVIIAVVVAVVVAGVMYGIGLATLKTYCARCFGMIQDAGPVVYFTAMAILPAFGFPLLAFTLTAGPTFGEQLGLGGVLVACALSLAINLTMTYWLARRWLRPWLEKMVTRAGYHVPVVPPEDRFELTLLLRITPGPPFFFQNYLLGLAEIPFRLYFALSLTFLMLQTVGLVIFGKYIAEGKGREAVMGISVFIAVLLVVHIVRRHYAKRGKQ